MNTQRIATVLLCLLAPPSYGDEISDELEKWSISAGHEYFATANISVDVGNVLYREDYLKGTPIRESGKIRYLCIPRDSTNRVALEKSATEHNWKRNNSIYTKKLPKPDIELAVNYSGLYDRIEGGTVFLNATVESLSQQDGATQVKGALGARCRRLWESNARERNTLFVNEVAHFSVTYLISLSHVTSTKEFENILSNLEARNPIANIESINRQTITITYFDDRISLDITTYGRDEGF